MPEEAHLDALQRALNCYLLVLGAVGECIGEACPEIGGLYRHRLSRLRARLAFDSSPKALEESCAAVAAELQEYAGKASGYIARHRGELRAASEAVKGRVRSLAQRQDFYSARLRQLTGKLESESAEAMTLWSCIESMSHESQSLAVRVEQEIDAIEARVKENEVTDPLTGLMNRRELERQIEVRTAGGDSPVLLQFQLTGEINDEIARQVGTRLGSQFRYKDFVCRWTDTDFLVLFQGPADIARMRAEQIVRWVAGSYQLENGQSVQIDVEVRLTTPELVA